MAIFALFGYLFSLTFIVGASLIGAGQAHDPSKALTVISIMALINILSVTYFITKELNRNCQEKEDN